MATPKDKQNRDADALEALASGEVPSSAQSGEGESHFGPSSGLMLLSEGEQEPSCDGDGDGDGDDFLHEMADEEQAQDANADLGDLVAPGQPRGDDLLGDVASASRSAAPLSVRSANLQSNMRRVHSTTYKQTMIPLLLVVGLMLIALSVVTLLMLMGRNDDPDSMIGGMTYLQAYGKYFILAALPMGAILLAGAWMFYLDVSKANRRR